MSEMPELVKKRFDSLKAHYREHGEAGCPFFAILTLANGTKPCFPQFFSSPADKDRFVYWLYEGINQGQITEILLLTETWYKPIPMSSGEDAAATLNRIDNHGVRNEPDKKEAWLIFWETKAGVKQAWLADIVRDPNGPVTLKDPEIFGGDGSMIGRFANIFAEAARYKQRKERHKFN